MIGVMLDNDYSQPLRRGMCCMRAHGAAHTICVAVKSDGVPVSALDWRANRLIDALAKAATSDSRISAGAIRLVGNADAAAEYVAGLAGATARAANTCVQHTMRDDGSLARTVCRDSRPQGPAIVPLVGKPYAGNQPSPIQARSTRPLRIRAAHVTGSALFSSFSCRKVRSRKRVVQAAYFERQAAALRER